MNIEIDLNQLEEEEENELLTRFLDDEGLDIWLGQGGKIHADHPWDAKKDQRKAYLLTYLVQDFLTFLYEFREEEPEENLMDSIKQVEILSHELKECSKLVDDWIKQQIKQPPSAS
jgi:hypothetical protein